VRRVDLDLWTIAVEGAVDRFCGRPAQRNPYSQLSAPDYREAWLLGWDEANHLLDIRGAEEARRWLTEAA